jgi:hypothetical protein
MEWCDDAAPELGRVRVRSCTDYPEGVGDAVDRG